MAALGMSLRALQSAIAVMARDDLTPSAKLVYVALASRHNQETGRCDPSLRRICGDTSLSERAVRNGLRQLEKAKVIQTVFRKKTTGNGKLNMTSRYILRGGAKFAYGVGQNLPPKQEIYQPSAFDDLANLIDGGDDA